MEETLHFGQVAVRPKLKLALANELGSVFRWGNQNKILKCPLDCTFCQRPDKSRPHM